MSVMAPTPTAPRLAVAPLRLLAAILGLLAVTSCEDTTGQLEVHYADLSMNRNPDFAIKCPGVFPQWDKTCQVVADCAVVKHLTACCGKTLVTAVSALVADKYQSFEDSCRGMILSQGCSCDAGSPQLVDDDGKALGASGMVQMVCERRTCRTKAL